MGYSPWGSKELDTTERLKTAQSKTSGDNKYTCLVGSVLRLNEVIYIEQLECHLIYDKHSVQVFVIYGFPYFNKYLITCTKCS